MKCFTHKGSEKWVQLLWHFTEERSLRIPSKVMETLTTVTNSLPYCQIQWILFLSSFSTTWHQSILLDRHDDCWLFSPPYWSPWLALPSLPSLSGMKLLKTGSCPSPLLSLLSFPKWSQTFLELYRNLYNYSIYTSIRDLFSEHEFIYLTTYLISPFGCSMGI